MITNKKLVKFFIILTIGADMRFKDNTIGLQSLKPQLVLALVIVDQVMKRFDQEALITSVNDGRHGRTSIHYDGGASDLRSKWFDQPHIVLKACLNAMGNNPDFDMILEYEGKENEHFHLEYQPKRKEKHKK